MANHKFDKTSERRPGRKSAGPRGPSMPRRAPATHFRADDGDPGTEAEGTVQWFNGDKGYGFVMLDGGLGSAFLHASALEARRLREPPEGARVLGRVRQGPKGLQFSEVLRIARPEGAAA